MVSVAGVVCVCAALLVPATVAAQMIDMVPMRRYGSAEEVATVVAFLLSTDASYVTGMNIEVAGGSA